ncbi:nucleotidyltransferase domain-containing protein [Candidatus Poribacteria bacterium]|nr:nucleotidyltransferase domain-containing protein [Candidatus Poribacteria bacterium]
MFHYTKNESDKIIDHIVNELKEYEFVSAIILFGSYARGNIKPFSDIDICVITEKNIDFNEKANIISYSSDKIDICIFWDLPLVIQFRVFKDGKVLYCRDEMSLHRVKVKTIMEYLDFQHILERYVKRTFKDI